MSEQRILVVEDDPDGQELVIRLLSQVNMAVDAASTAEDAWTMLQQRPYTAAIVDLALPGQDGFQLLDLIRSEAATQPLPCIAVTAFHTPELRQQALQSGFDAYFPKPINRTLFLGAMDDLVGK